jgi:type I restriction enzyme M protein
MSSEKILWSLLDCFRGSSLETFASLELSLQILAWAKLSVMKQLPDELCLNGNSHPTNTDSLKDIFKRLTTLEGLGEDRLAFENFFPKRTDTHHISTAIEIAQEVAQSGVLDYFAIPESFYELMSKGADGSHVIPSEVADLMIRLVGDMGGQEVYCPYDSFCYLASRAYRLGANVAVEMPVPSPIPWLINLLTGTNIHAVTGNPIRQPSFVQEGTLKQFDISIAFPPFGMKYDTKVIEKDWFKRFPERTSSISVLAIRHILAQTQNKAVIAVPNNILFSRGAEYSLREYLLKKRLLEAVINLPSALLTGTAVQFSILLLDLHHQASTVRFVNGSAEKFFTKDGKGRSRLVHWEALLHTFHTANDDALVVAVPTEDIIKKDVQLEVSQYLLPPEQKQIERLLKISNTCQLQDIVEFIRPVMKTGDEGQIDVFEIKISDFPEYGYLQVPSKPTQIVQLNLTAKDKNQFLRTGDIVIAIKGSVGKVAISPENVPPAGKGGWVVNQSCFILRAKGRIDPKVLFMYLRSDIGQILLKRIVSGATIPLIQLRALQELRVIVPDENEAQKIIKTFNRQVELQTQIELLKQEQQILSKAHWSIGY